MPLTAVVLDGEVQSALTIVRSLGTKGIKVICGSERASGMALHSRYARETFVYPSPREDVAGFVASVEGACRKETDGVVVFACSDACFLPISRERQRFGETVRVLARPEDVETAFDKLKTLELARSLGVNIPKTYKIENQEDLGRVVDRLAYPLVVKPRRSCTWVNGVGVKGTVKIVGNASELKDACHSHWRATGEWPLIQEYVDGEEFGVFYFYNQGKPVTWFAHKRLRSLSPYGGASCLRESIKMPEDLDRDARKLLDALHWNGVAMVEFKRGRDGKPRLMEINGRFWGSLPLAIWAGVDFPYQVYALANGQKEEAVGPYRIGVSSRHVLADFKHLLSVFFGSSVIGVARPEKWRTLKEFVKFGGPLRREDVYAWGDLKPTFWEVLDIIKRLP